MKVRELHLTLALPVVGTLALLFEGSTNMFWYLLNAGSFFMTMFVYSYLKSKGRHGNDTKGFRKVAFSIGNTRK